MAKKKAITKKSILTLYMNYVLEKHENPKSIHQFSKMNNFEEAEFYNYFASFEAIQEAIFKTFLKTPYKHYKTVLNMKILVQNKSY